MANGFMGKILWVDLSAGIIKEESLDEKLCRDYIGGYGLGARIIFERQRAGVDPLGPENTLGFMTGVLSGTQALAASRYAVVGKSPLTGTWGDANSGGDFGPNLKFSGFDAVFFTGISPGPVYLLIDSGKAEIRDASHLWGKDSWDTEDMIRAELGEDTEVACIGPSGEKLALIAAVINNKGRAAARSGLGALMGSKRLKAVAVRGKLKVPVFDEARIADLRKATIPQLGGPVEVFRSIGTPGILVPCAQSGDAPIKNWGGAQTLDFPEVEKIGGNVLIERQEKRYGCYRCVVGCGGELKAGTGEFQYPAGNHKPEYETLAMFGTSCLNSDVESIIKANDICNRYGLDTISAGATIAFTIECYENGLITKEDTDGIEMTWGNAGSIVAMTEKMAKREGFGDVIADGTRKAAERIGKGAEKYAMNIQGQEYGAHDPRKAYGFAAAYKMDATPGRHTRDGGFPVVGLNKPEIDPEAFYGPGVAQAQKIGMSFFHVIDSAGCCQFVFLTFPSGQVFVDFINAASGWNLTIDDVVKTGERIADIRQAFNVREGLNVFNFKNAQRMVGNPPLAAGPLAGKSYDEDLVAREFCEAMDWDTANGKPSKKKLLELGMEDVVKVLYP
ncbi:MAG: aldehyde ferredoxin oxidoreductase family protein [Dehalococcoidales bacterium]|nr:aldehyde ferredoxin oxidoreductase family protein [Dehalococcoidales bacterium]